MSVPYANNENNCLGVYNGSYVPNKDAGLFEVALCEAIVQPASIKASGPLIFKVTPVITHNISQTQQAISRFLLTAAPNGHLKCCFYDPLLNDINSMIY